MAISGGRGRLVNPLEINSVVSPVVVQVSQPVTDRTDSTVIRGRYWLAITLIVAGVLRILVAWFSPHLVFPDEIFQVQDPAHKLVYGTGVVAWEFVLGIRSWLLPGIVAGLMAVAKLYGDDPSTSTFLVTLFMTICSLAPVLCAYLWGYRFGGLGGAVIAGGFAAVWIDLVYFSTHPLTDVMAGQCLVAGLYLGYPGYSVESWRRLFWAGVMFGLTFAFRFHLAPALGVAIAWIAGLDLRQRWLPILGGALVPVLFLGVLDTATLGLPFQSIWLNAWVNLVLGVSEEYGTAPWYMAIAYQLSLWGGTAVLLAVAALLGMNRLPLLLAVAAIIGVVYAAVPHKGVSVPLCGAAADGRAGWNRHGAGSGVAIAPAGLTSYRVPRRVARARLLERRVGSHGSHPVLLIAAQQLRGHTCSISSDRIRPGCLRRGPARATLASNAGSNALADVRADLRTTTYQLCSRRGSIQQGGYLESHHSPR